MDIAKADLVGVLVIGCFVLSACGGSEQEQAAKPDWLTVASSIQYDGKSDDLLMAGVEMDAILGKTPAPSYADPASPTAAELRRTAIFAAGDSKQGFGTLFGPNIGVDGKPVANDAVKIPGEEVLAYSGDGLGFFSAAMALQIPSTFDKNKACILAVPANGSARMYADVQRFGGWGLRRNCAVVYTDKGLANGVHDLSSSTVNLVNGLRTSTSSAGTASHFTAPLTDTARTSFLSNFPNRIAFKHAHSRQNPDALWGREVLRSIEFAVYILNQRFADSKAFYNKDNTTVIVVGDSNGGGAALLAAEQDSKGWIDGVVAGQPQIQPQASDKVVVKRGGKDFVGGGKSLLDYFTQAILYQPCATLATPNAPSASAITFAANRCASLLDKGLLISTTLPDQATEALNKIHDLGWELDSDDLIPFHFLVAPGATANKYANSQGRFGVEDRLCGQSIAAVDSAGRPRAATALELASIFSSAAGGAPAGSIDLVNDNDPTGPRRESLSISASTNRQDYNIDGMLCLRNLVTGSSAEAKRVQTGIAELRATGNVRGKPTLIVHGRTDARVPTMFSSRPYVALNSLAENNDRLRYIEVNNINHLGAGGAFDSHYVSLTYYEEQALGMMWNHLKTGAALPPHQYVRTVSRGGLPGSAPVATAANFPSISATPKVEDQITVKSGTIVLPD
ncbi:MAG: 3-hydroxybutyrate oligomer hydrolase family protein [Rhodoferax sp.]